MDNLLTYFNAITGRERIGFIDLSDVNLYIAAAAILFNPLFWNTIARLEYHNHILTTLFRSPYYGCYALAITIFALGIARDHLFKTALDTQPFTPILHQPVLGAAVFGFGQMLVLSSMYALGVTGTYLGDYFGILMDHKVEGFPFNLSIAMGSPMYVGSTLCFLGTTLWTGRGAGLVLTAIVAVCYAVATVVFEDPFTGMIYAKKEEEDDDARPQTRSMTKKSPRKQA